MEMNPVDHSIVRLEALLDNATFWGGIDACTEAIKADKAAKKKAKEDAKKAKKDAKKFAKEAEKAEKKAEKDAEKKESLILAWMAGSGGGVPMTVQWMVGSLLIVWLTVSVANQVTQHWRRQGYEIVADRDDNEDEQMLGTSDAVTLIV